MNNSESVKNTITIATNAAFPTLRKGKAFKALLFVATEVQKTLAPGSVHTVPMSLFNELLKFKLSSKDTAAILEDLEKIKVDWGAYNSDWSGFSHVVSSCRYDRKKDTISFSFDPMFVTEYLDKKTPFKRIPISLVMGFRSNYAMKIYELAYQYYDPQRKEGRTPAYSYNELRNLFNLSPDQYKNSGHFFQKIIKNPLREVAEITDYHIDFHHNKRRGLLRRYWFSVRLSPQAKFDFARVDKTGDLFLKDAEAKKRVQMEDEQRAIKFLNFWKEEFKAFSKRKMTEEEKRLWIDPLLDARPSLSTFAECWIIENYFKASERRKSEYIMQSSDPILDDSKKLELALHN